MNKRQGSLFNFGVKKSRIEGVCDSTNNDSLTLTNCHDLNVSFVLLFWEMKPSRLIRHLNTKHSDLVNKPTEFFTHKRDALIIEKKIISQASTTETSLLTAAYLI